MVSRILVFVRSLRPLDEAQQRHCHLWCLVAIVGLGLKASFELRSMSQSRTLGVQVVTTIGYPADLEYLATASSFRHPPRCPCWDDATRSMQLCSRVPKGQRKKKGSYCLSMLSHTYKPSRCGVTLPCWSQSLAEVVLRMPDDDEIGAGSCVVLQHLRGQGHASTSPFLRKLEAAECCAQ